METTFDDRKWCSNCLNVFSHGGLRDYEKRDFCSEACFSDFHHREMLYRQEQEKQREAIK
jgi:hypothetical protein